MSSSSFSIDSNVMNFFIFFGYTVLSSGAHGGGNGDNSSMLSEEELRLCGSNFCVMGNHAIDNLERPPDSEIFEISTIYLTCIVLATIIIAVFLDPLSR